MKKLLIAFALFMAILGAPRSGYALLNTANFAFGKLTQPIPYATGPGATFNIAPNVNSGTFPASNFLVVIYSSVCNSASNCPSREIMLISSVNGNTFTIGARDQEGTAHYGDWSTNDNVVNIVTAGTLNDVLNQVWTNPTITGILTVPSISSSGTSTLNIASVKQLGTAFLASSGKYATFNAIDAAAHAAGGTVIMDANLPQSAGTYTATAPVAMLGGRITSAGTSSLYINSAFTSGSTQAFSGYTAGQITFAAGTVKEINPQWWGMTLDGTGDNSTAINSAINSLPSNGGIVQLPLGAIRSAATITIDGNVVSSIILRGHGFGTTSNSNTPTKLIKASTLNGDLIVVKMAATQLENFSIDAEPGSGGNGIRVLANRIRLRNISVFNQTAGFGILMGANTVQGANPSININLCSLENVISNQSGTGIYIGDYTDVVAPNANAMTLIGVLADNNIYEGIAFGNAWFNFAFSTTTQTNGGKGIYLTSQAANNIFFGGDTAETNTGGNIVVDPGASHNQFYGFADGGYTDNGTQTLFMGRSSYQVLRKLTASTINGYSANMNAAVGEFRDGALSASPSPILNLITAGNANTGRGPALDFYPPLSGTVSLGARIAALRESSVDTTALSLQTAITGTLMEVMKLTSKGAIQSLQTTNGPVGSMTLSSGATTTVSNTSVTSASRISFQCTNATCAGLRKACGDFLFSNSTGSYFLITVPTGTVAAGTETLNYTLLN